MKYLSFEGWSNDELRSFFDEVAMDIESGNDRTSEYNKAQFEMMRRHLSW